MSKITERLAALRAELQKHHLDAWYISGTDPHNSEYLPERWLTRAYISGFTGSFGKVVVTKDKALLWTDTRYFLQAEEQLQGTGIEMKKLRVPDAVSPENWLAQHLPSGSRVGVDGQTVSIQTFRQIHSALAEKEIELVKTPDFFDAIWKNRPENPSDPVFELATKFAGKSRGDKLALVQQKLDATGADFQVITMLDELAWFFNLRGADIAYNPVFLGFGLVGKNNSRLFADSKKINPELAETLKKEGIELQDYNAFYAFLNSIQNKKILIDGATASYSVFEALQKNNEIMEHTSVISHLKAQKNSTEIDGFKNAMKKDGVALVEFLYWLNKNIGKTEITEYSIGRKLAEFRGRQNDFMGESFPPIVGYKHHGAIVHLSVGPDNALPVEKEGILLFDSGGQYLDGTTDITRTVAVGEITEQQKTDFTIVLKGMIALTEAVFPEGTKGCHLDILARKPMWEQGMNYGHGTGHGVGHFLNVHEGPMAIRQEYNPNSIYPGMVMSNEPAFYRQGEYGIRTENMMVCVERETTAYGRFFGFETLTLCPIDTKLIKTDLLSEEEKSWINRYHKKVNAELKPLLGAEFHLLLDQQTREI